MSADLSYLSVILQSIAVAVAIFLAVAAWRWLRVALERGQLGAENEALAQVATYARIFVAAAEQTLSKQPGFAKLDWVLNQFDAVLPDMDKALVRSFVEAAVAALPKTPAKPVTLAAPAASATSFSATPPTPANCDDLAPTPPAETSHSHKERGKAKMTRTG
jgi:hypothetical protein